MELNDVTDYLKQFGIIRDLEWETFKNTSIKTGSYTTYIELSTAEIAQKIPGFIEIAGQKIGLRHRMIVTCKTCGQQGHNERVCQKVHAKWELIRIQHNRRQKRMQLEWKEPQ